MQTQSGRYVHASASAYMFTNVCTRINTCPCTSPVPRPYTTSVQYMVHIASLSRISSYQVREHRYKKKLTTFRSDLLTLVIGWDTKREFLRELKTVSLLYFACGVCGNEFESSAGKRDRTWMRPRQVWKLDQLWGGNSIDERISGWIYKMQSGLPSSKCTKASPYQVGAFCCSKILLYQRW